MSDQVGACHRPPQHSVFAAHKVTHLLSQRSLMYCCQNACGCQPASADAETCEQAGVELGIKLRGQAMIFMATP